MRNRPTFFAYRNIDDPCIRKKKSFSRDLLFSCHYSFAYFNKLQCGPMLNVMVAVPNIGGALCSTPQSLADAH